jgi:hypothetical protein
LTQVSAGLDRPYWLYNSDSQSLHLDSGIALKFRLAYSSSRAGSYIGENAFGVRRRITKLVATEVDLVPTEKPESAAIGYGFTIKAPPEDARAIAFHAVLELDGNLTPDESGRMSGCNEDGETATVSNPVETITSVCHVSGKITRAALIDSRNGTILREWIIGRDPPRDLIKNPEWESTPDQSTLNIFYPYNAKISGVAGEATITCDVLTEAMLHSCTVKSENPTGYGFGQAAMQLAFRYKLKAGSVVDVSDSPRVEITVRFAPSQ